MRLIQTLKWSGVWLRDRAKAGFLSLSGRKPANDARQWELDDAAVETLDVAQTRSDPMRDRVDDRTWSDLEMQKVFYRLDNSVSPLGAQYLYALLRSYQTGETLQQNSDMYDGLVSSPDTTARLRKALAPLNCKSAAELAGFVFGDDPTLAMPRHYRLFYVISAAAVLCPFGIIVSSWFLWPSMALWILSIFLHWRYGSTVGRYAPALASLATVLGCVREMNHSFQGNELSELKELAALDETAKRIRKKVSWVFLGKQGGNDLTVILMEYLNVLCLFELNACCHAIAAVNEQRAALARVFDIVARLDAFQGLARSLSKYPYVCRAERKGGRSFNLVGVYHPLIAHAVHNSISGNGRSALLSGTNMAGKTTFMKTLGINLLLARTIGLCLAKSAVLPPARVKTLIERKDTISEGQSYFFSEASELLRAIRDAERSDQDCWFVVDELFRGTNAVERVAASNALLRFLANRWMVVASTHDRELIDQLANEFDSYHFSEVITDGSVRFDYRLRNGSCDARNAIKLLTLAGYPKEVTDLAEKLANQSSAHSDPRITKLSSAEGDGLELNQ